MNRYADPSRCPDCGRTIVPQAPSCPGCGLLLSGPVARQLFLTLARADELLVALRGTPAPVRAPSTFVPSRLEAPRTLPPPRPRPTLSAASVPKILLTLGAGCLLVAALVFLAVTWSVLGVGGRTAALVGFTAIAAILTGWMVRRRLRAAAESLALVGYGLLTLDLVGADNAGWFGDLSTTGLLVLLGLLLTVTGAAGALVVRRAGAMVLTGAEAVTAAGTGITTAGLVEGSWLTPASAALVATVLAAFVTVLVQQAGLRVATVGAGAVTVLGWLALTDLGVVSTLENATWNALWAHLHVWPLLASAALVAALAVPRRLDQPARVAAAAVAHILVMLALVAPLLDGDATALTLLGIVLLTVTAAATRMLPRPWGLSNALTQLVAAVGVLGAVAEIAGTSATRVGVAAATGWAGTAGDRLPPLQSAPDQAAGWLLPLGTAALVLAAHEVIRAAVDRPWVVLLLQNRSVGATVLAASAVGALACYPVPLSLVLGMLLLVSAAHAGWWVATAHSAPLSGATVFLACGVFLSLHSPGLTLAALTVALAITGLVHLRAGAPEVAATAGALLASALAGVTWTFGALVDADPVWVALVGLLVLGALVLLAPYAPEHLWSSQPVISRTGLEVGSALSALALGIAGAGDAARTATWTAGYLTLAGVVVTVMSLLRPDRRPAGWVGGALLALASWVRLWDLGVTAPEAYTLPSAVALLLVGLEHLRRHRDSSTVTALTPGLSLALVPSLLWLLDEPYGVRVPLLGLACLVLVLAGARLRWTAPLAVGAAVGGMLVLRLAAPYVGDSVPHWALIGAAGALLVGVGVTWEQRLQDARDVLAYVRRLR